MSKRQKKQSRPHPSAPAEPRPPLLLFTAVIAGLLLVALATLKFLGQKSDDQTYIRRPKGTITYTRDIAPIIYEQCLTCHRPGDSAHLDLVSYSDAKKYAKLISKVVASGYMPPWLPEPGFAEFLDERLLTPDQIGLIQQWAAEGAVEGNPADLPPAPKSVEGWQLGKPDLVITMPEPYLLAANGKDVYRNFVIPIPVDQTRFVQAVEFRPGNPKVVHHAAMRRVPEDDRHVQVVRVVQELLADPEQVFRALRVPRDTRSHARVHHAVVAPGEARFQGTQEVHV